MLPLTCVVDPNNEGTAVVRTTGTQTAGALLASLQEGAVGVDSRPGSSSGGATNTSSGHSSGFNLSINRNDFLLGMTSDVLSSVIASISDSDDSVESGHTESGEISNPEYIPANNTTPSVTTTLPPISAE
jgi:hypothetical protein